MPSKPDYNRFYHMLESAREAIEYANSRTRQDLDSDRPLAHSLVRCLEIIGEAAGKVSAKGRDEYPKIQWDDMIGMRNRLIHAYFDINLNIVWQTVKQELPKLVDELAEIVKE